MKKILFSIAAVLATASISFGQSQGFKLGQWVEIQNAILKELNRNYVDSLPLDRMERVGIDAMLENLDPYTVFIPEEDEEDLEMLLNKSYGGFELNCARRPRPYRTHHYRCCRCRRYGRDYRRQAGISSQRY